MPVNNRTKCLEGRKEWGRKEMIVRKKKKTRDAFIKDKTGERDGRRRWL